MPAFRQSLPLRANVRNGVAPYAVRAEERALGRLVLPEALYPVTSPALDKMPADQLRSRLYAARRNIRSGRVSGPEAVQLAREAACAAAVLMERRIKPGGAFVLNGRPGPQGCAGLRSDLLTFQHDAVLLCNLRRLAGSEGDSRVDAALLKNLRLLSEYYRALSGHFSISAATGQAFHRLQQQLARGLSARFGLQREALAHADLRSLAAMLPASADFPTPRLKETEPGDPAQKFSRPERMTPQKKGAVQNAIEPSRRAVRPDRGEAAPVDHSLLAEAEDLLSDRLAPAEQMRELLVRVEKHVQTGSPVPGAHALCEKCAEVSEKLIRSRIQPNHDYTVFQLHGTHDETGNPTLRSDLRQFAADAARIARIAPVSSAASPLVAGALLRNLRLLSKFYSVLASRFRISAETEQAFGEAQQSIISALPAQYSALKARLSGVHLARSCKMVREDGSTKLYRNQYLHEVDDALTDPYAEQRLRGAQQACAVVRSADGRSHGSGICVSPQGTLLTNAHVIDGMKNGIVVEFPDGRTFSARTVYVDERHDIAVLDVQAYDRLPFAPLSAGPPARGSRIVVIGSPGNDPEPFDVETGVIVDHYSPARKREGGLVFNIPHVWYGNSGSPIFSYQGEIVGLVNAMDPRSGLEYGIQHQYLYKALRHSGLPFSRS